MQWNSHSTFHNGVLWNRRWHKYVIRLYRETNTNTQCNITWLHAAVSSKKEKEKEKKGKKLETKKGGAGKDKDRVCIHVLYVAL